MSTTLTQQLQLLQNHVNQYVKLAQQLNVDIAFPYLRIQELLNSNKETTTPDDPIDDEKLYEYWTTYRAEKEPWFEDYKPKIQRLKKENKAYPEQLLKDSEACLTKIITAAKTYLNAYKAHKEDITGEKMQKKFAEWTALAEKELNDPELGWLYTKELIQQMLAKLAEEKAAISKINEHIKLHKAKLMTWKEVVVPNIEALLVRQEDVDVAQKIYDNLQDLLAVIATSPASVQKAFEQWKTLAEKPKWEERLKKTQKAFDNTKEKAKGELVDGNPDLAPNEEDYQYAPPKKKDVLYRKGKNDQHEIDPNDIQQGDINDCFLLSSIGALAQSNPESIQQLIHPLPDGNFEVTLHLRTDPEKPDRTATKILVKNEFVRNGKKNCLCRLRRSRVVGTSIGEGLCAGYGWI